MNSFHSKSGNNIPDDELGGTLLAAVEAASHRQADEATIRRVIERASQLASDSSVACAAREPASLVSRRASAFRKRLVLVASWSGVAAAVDGSYHGLIDKWLRTIKDVYRIYHDELDAIADHELRHQRLVELNVREQVYRLCSTSFVQRRWGDDMRTHVHGWAYDLRHGLLKDLEIDPADEPARGIYDLDGL